MKNFFSTTGFYWWTGVVEDRMDPLLLGRCRIRIMGYHTENKGELPTKDLAWAMPVQPITSAAVTGFGTSPLGPLEGSWVIGFFADGDDMQQPMFMGTFAGIPQSSFFDSLGDSGFQDPDKKYPLRELLDEPDTDRLARNQGISETIVAKKRDTRDKNVETAMGGQKWNQPIIPYSAKYPYNHVTHTESGHIIETDDTPAGERVHIYHRMGTFVEVHPDGSMVRRIVGSDYEIIDGNESIHIKGKANITVDGSCNIYVKNNCNLEVNGNLKMHGHGDVELKAGKDLIMTAKGAVKIHADDKVDIHASKKVNIKGTTGLKMTGTTKTTISSPITEVVILKALGMGVSLVPPTGPIIVPPSTIGTKSTSEPSIKNPTAVLTPEERLTKIAEIIELQDDKTQQGKENAAVLQDEVDTNEKVSTPSNTETDPVEKSNACAAAQNVINAAEKDLGMVETGTAAGFPQNYGGKPGNGEIPGPETPRGVRGRIDEMHKNAGVPTKIPKGSKLGEGSPWCASAVTTWWKEAGLPTPPGGGSCKNWGAWARANGTYSTTPKLGAAILYGPLGGENHMGIVTGINDDGTVSTIEGNTSLHGFNANGCGCFRKKSNPNKQIAYVLIPDTLCQTPLPAPTTEDLTGDIKTFIENLEGRTDLCPESVRQQLPEIAEKFGIDTPLRMSHFLAQCKHESANWTATRENLNYSAKGLRAIFGKYFTSDSMAMQYQRNPQKIANLVYANRMGNGSVESGEGYKYRGRGYIQLTGKSNYAAFNRYISDDVVANPDLVESKYALMSAAFYWSNRSLNSTADRGEQPVVVVAVTQKVNGGQNGYPDRQRNFDSFIALA
jgi:putative chitinase